MRQLLGLLLLSFALPLFAAPLGNPNAPKGGTFNVGFPGYPKSLLFYLSFEELAAGVDSLIFESLLDMDPETYEFVPLLASEWKISADQKLFTFKINPKAKFSDGVAVTAKDVKFTWDTLLNPKNKTAPFQAYLNSFESCTAVDDHTVEIKAKNIHFKNLEKIAGLMILPEHFFSKGDFNKAFNSKVLGSGPYLLESVKQGERIFLKRDSNYWGKDLTQNIGRYNFDRIVFKSVSDYEVQFELFKRGDIDYFYFLSAKMWSTETDGRQFQKNWIRKLKADNQQAFATQGMVWNLRKPLFKDIKVRTALSHLMNREKWIKDLFYNNYVASAGVVGMNSEYHSSKIKPLAYDPQKARALLKEAGWTKVGSDGILVKDGLRFEFDTIADNPGLEKFLTLYQEDLKKVGIKMNIRLLDWATSLKLVDDRQFDSTSQARGRDIHPGDFAVAWGSDQADIKGSANTSGYKNTKVDELAKEIDLTFDKAKRIPLVKQLDEIIAAEQPISFTWEGYYYRLAYWNKFGFPGKGYFKYSDWKNVFHYWWLDAGKDAKLTKAVAADQAVKD
jgi:microcin C transport system substrate-binding protein